VIRNVCIHVSNEQPLLADLYELPTADDAGLVCTNVRSMDGKRPVFVDQIASTFFFPYHIVRFIEIPESEMAAHTPRGGGGGSAARRARATAAADEPDDVALDAGGEEDGSGSGEPESFLPVAVGVPQGPGGVDDELELEIDEGFLQRIRDL
jgi:hypothetical protein